MPRTSANALMNRRRIVEDDGHTFASAAEHKRYCELRLLVRSGDIDRLMVHPTWRLVVRGVDVGSYTADFAYLVIERVGAGSIRRDVIEDVKPKRKKPPGYFHTRESALRIKIFEAVYGRPVTIVAR
jgi:hypothetical protein